MQVTQESASVSVIFFIIAEVIVVVKILSTQAPGPDFEVLPGCGGDYTHFPQQEQIIVVIIIIVTIPPQPSSSDFTYFPEQLKDSCCEARITLNSFYICAITVLLAPTGALYVMMRHYSSFQRNLVRCQTFMPIYIVSSIYAFSILNIHRFSF